MSNVASTFLTPHLQLQTHQIFENCRPQPSKCDTSSVLASNATFHKRFKGIELLRPHALHDLTLIHFEVSEIISLLTILHRKGLMVIIRRQIGYAFL